MIHYKLEDLRIAVLDEKKEIGEITWSDATKFIIIDHTFVDPSYRGLKIAETLVLKAVEYAREQKIKILPLCPYAKKEFERKLEYLDVLKK